MISRNTKTMKLDVSGNDGAQYFEKVMTPEEFDVVDWSQQADLVLNGARDALEFRTEAGEWVKTSLKANHIGPTCLSVLQAVLAYRGEYTEPADFVELTGYEKFRENNNISRHLVTLRRALGESPRDSRFLVTRRNRPFGVMFPGAWRYVCIDRLNPNMAAGMATKPQQESAA